MNIDNRNQLMQIANKLSSIFYEDPFLLFLFDINKRKFAKCIKLYSFLLRYAYRNKAEIIVESEKKVGTAIYFVNSGHGVSTLKAILSGGLFLPFQLGIHPFNRLSIMDKITTEYHKRIATYPHIYLQIIGVDLDHRGKGLGGKLLNKVIQDSIEKKLPIFLETMTEENVSMYQHFGFDLVETVKIPNQEYKLYFMLRKLS